MENALGASTNAPGEAHYGFAVGRPIPLIAARGLPRHIGIIMDGNGRWAERRGEGRTSGHRAGSRSVRKIVRLCRRIGVEALTLYAFSFQNWKRPDDEVEALMELLIEFLIEERQSILDNGIRLEAIGELDQLPRSVRAVLDALRAESAHNDDMVLSLALSYGGQEEIARAAQDLAREVAAGNLAAEDIDVDALRARIPSVSDVGEPDLDHPHEWRAAAEQLPALRQRLRRALLQRTALARLRSRRPLCGHRELPGPRAALRVGLGA